LTVSKIAPAGADSVASGGWVGAAQTDGLSVGAEGQSGGEFQDGDVAVHGPVVVGWVVGDLPDVDGLTTAGVEGRSGPDAQLACRESSSAMGSGQDVGAINDGTTADVGAIVTERDLMGVLVNGRWATTNNPAIQIWDTATGRSQGK